MATLMLKILLTLYILQSLLKFCVHFFVNYETRKNERSPALGLVDGSAAEEVSG